MFINAGDLGLPPFSRFTAWKRKTFLVDPEASLLEREMVFVDEIGRKSQQGGGTV